MRTWQTEAVYIVTEPCSVHHKPVTELQAHGIESAVVELGQLRTVAMPAWYLSPLYVNAHKGPGDPR